MKTIFTIYLVLTAVTTTVMAEHAIDESENPQFLFVMSAHAGSYDGEILTLTGVPSVIYFSDRPYRIAGHISLEEFVEMWGEGSDRYTIDSPNATLSIYDDNGDNTVLELMNPEMKDNSIKFTVRILYGELPSIINTCSIFIDEFINSGAWTGTP